MQKSIRIHAIDRWNEWKQIDEDELKDEDKKIKERIEELKLGNWCDIRRNNDEYKYESSRNNLYQLIIGVLSFAWIIIAVIAVFILKESFIYPYIH